MGLIGSEFVIRVGPVKGGVTSHIEWASSKIWKDLLCSEALMTTRQLGVSTWHIQTASQTWT